MKKIRVMHETFYDYSFPVELSHHLAYLSPRIDSSQKVLNHEFQIHPNPDSTSINVDYHGNTRTFFTITKPHKSLKVSSQMEVEILDPYSDFNPETTPTWETIRDLFIFSENLPFKAASQYLYPSPFIPIHEKFKLYALQSFSKDKPIGLSLIDLNQRIHNDFKYKPLSTEINTPVLEVLDKKSGVCQDFSHVFIACLRSLGIPAHYISGYILTKPPEGQKKLIGSDASHAWIGAYCPGSWGEYLELDPTNKMIAGSSHIRIAKGRDFGDVSPLRGIIRGGGEHILKVAVTSEEFES
jgi:transglutaminase-like putative cysteine protease